MKFYYTLATAGLAGLNAQREPKPCDDLTNLQGLGNCLTDVVETLKDLKNGQFTNKFEKKMGNMVQDIVNVNKEDMFMETNAMMDAKIQEAMDKVMPMMEQMGSEIGDQDGGRPAGGRPDEGRPDGGRPDGGRPNGGRPNNNGTWSDATMGGDYGRPQENPYDMGSEYGHLGNNLMVTGTVFINNGQAMYGSDDGEWKEMEPGMQRPGQGKPNEWNMSDISTEERYERIYTKFFEYEECRTKIGQLVQLEAAQAMNMTESYNAEDHRMMINGVNERFGGWEDEGTAWQSWAEFSAYHAERWATQWTATFLEMPHADYYKDEYKYLVAAVDPYLQHQTFKYCTALPAIWRAEGKDKEY